MTNTYSPEVAAGTWRPPISCAASRLAASCRSSSSTRPTASGSTIRTPSCSKSASCRRYPIDQTVANDIMAQLLVLESQDPRPRHHDVHQLARRLVPST